MAELHEQSNPLLLGRYVLSEDFHAVLRLELADEARIPELARYAEVLAAKHQSIALARLRRGWNAVGIEVFLFSASNCNEPDGASARVTRHIPTNRPSKTDKSIFPADILGPNVSLTSRREAPATRSEGPVQGTTVLDLGQVYETVYEENESRTRENAGTTHEPGLISTSRGLMGANRTSATSLVKG